MLMHLPVALVRTAVHTMANVDASSALLLNANEVVVDFALDHNCLPLARLSLHAVQLFDSLGSTFIALVAWMLSQI